MRSLKKIIAGIMAASLMLTCVSVQADGLKDGTYTQSEQGFQGDVTVSLTIENGKITDAVVEGPNETEGVGLAALPVLQEQILEKCRLWRYDYQQRRYCCNRKSISRGCR